MEDKEKPQEEKDKPYTGENPPPPPPPNDGGDKPPHP